MTTQIKDKEVDEIQERMTAERRKIAKATEEASRVIFYKLKMAGYKTAEIEFDGSGDDGSIHSVMADGDEMDKLEQSTLKEEITKWAYSVLEAADIDWYNNDGGYGSIAVNLDKGSYELEINTRFTDSNLALAGKIDVPAYEGAPNTEQDSGSGV